MAIGVPYDLFKHLNPTKLKPFSKADNIRWEKRMADEERIAYMHGVYTANAVSLLGKAEFPKEPLHFFDFSKKMSENAQNGENLTEEEKIMYRKKLIAGLQIMQANFEREKKKELQNAQTSEKKV